MAPIDVSPRVLMFYFVLKAELLVTIASETGKEGTHSTDGSITNAIADQITRDIASNISYMLDRRRRGWRWRWRRWWSRCSCFRSSDQVPLVPGQTFACLPLAEAEIAKLIFATAATEC